VEFWANLETLKRVRKGYKCLKDSFAAGKCSGRIINFKMFEKERWVFGNSKRLNVSGFWI